MIAEAQDITPDNISEGIKFFDRLIDHPLSAVIILGFLLLLFVVYRHGNKIFNGNRESDKKIMILAKKLDSNTSQTIKNMENVAQLQTSITEIRQNQQNNSNALARIEGAISGIKNGNNTVH